MTAKQVSRRSTLKFAGLIALAPVRNRHALLSHVVSRSAHGYGTDPDLLTRPVSWPTILSTSQIAKLKALADIILPAEPPHPSASENHVHEFLGEWVSAPYPTMQADRELIVPGLATLDTITYSQHGTQFEDSRPSWQITAFDQVCGSSSRSQFATRLIELVCGGYYTTHEGHAAIGYVGNLGLTSFIGPAPSVVRHLEEALTQIEQSAVGMTQFRETEVPRAEVLTPLSSDVGR